MERLWAPWRIKYVSKQRKRGCIFCRARLAHGKEYVIFKTEYSTALLNIFPYNNGHMLISPARHLKQLSDLKEVEIIDLFKALNKAKGLLDKVLKPQGYNIGINTSTIAGSGIPEHLHLHIVPRWKGDTNFMPVLYNTRVISQALDDLYKKLKDAGSKKD